MKNYIIYYLFSILFCSCISNTSSQNELNLLDAIKLNILEPSGITNHENHLFIASDYNGFVYKTNLKGEILEKMVTGFSDLEGVTVNNKGSFFIVNENKRTLVKLKLNGKALIKCKIKGKQEHGNNGLEGICYYPPKDNYFVVNEKAPKQLLSISKKGEILKKIKIGYVNDLSGICFDEKSKTLWLVSDESQQLFQISVKGKIIKKYHLPIVKAEGVTIFNNKIYIVSDLENKLYVFKKPN